MEKYSYYPGAIANIAIAKKAKVGPKKTKSDVQQVRALQTT